MTTAVTYDRPPAAAVAILRSAGLGLAKLRAARATWGLTIVAVAFALTQLVRTRRVREGVA